MANFKTLRNKWQNLKGGRNREVFKKNLTQNIVLKIEENSVKSEELEEDEQEELEEDKEEEEQTHVAPKVPG